MRVAIVRRAKGVSFSMDVYADALVDSLRKVEPDWDIVEFTPLQSSHSNPLLRGLHKYYARYCLYPHTIQRHPDVDVYHVIDHSDGHIVYPLSRGSSPVVLTCHDLINFRQPENISDQAAIPAISTWIWKYAVKGIVHADHIITVSDHTAKDVMSLFGVEPSRLTTVYNGVEPIFRQLSPSKVDEIRQHYGLDCATVYLLNVGSTHPRKNILTILKALNILNRHGISVHFLKAGSDFSDEQKTFIRDRHLSPLITYLGKPDKETLVELYNIADVLVAPSLYEGFGITPLEAMACGTPVISSNVTSLPEVIGDAGIMVDPLDADAIAHAVQYLRTHADERQNLVNKGLDQVKKFTWNNHAKRATQIYREVLKTKISI